MLADNAFRLQPWCMTPFTSPEITSRERASYNKVHLSTIMVVERAFGCLKGRWKILHYGIDSQQLAYIVKVIHACCVLHNLCINNNDCWEDQLILDEDAEDNTQNNDNNSDSYYNMENLIAIRKREEIVNTFID